MGGNNTKLYKYAEKPLGHNNSFKHVDYELLATQTGLTKKDVNDLFKKFTINNPDGCLNREEFRELYISLRYEPSENLNAICEFIFRAFDSDHNGVITFNEFLIGFALTSRGDLRKKLDYAFALYDSDSSGYLDKGEVEEVINGMLDLIGADRTDRNVQRVAGDCLAELDTNGDGKVSKDEFIDGLLKNYSLRSIMSPFS